MKTLQQDSAKGRGNSGAGPRSVLPWIFGLVGLLFAFHPTLFSGLARIQTDLGDPRALNYVLEHTFRWISGGDRAPALWSPPVFFPQPETFAYAETLLSVAPVYWLFRLFGAPPDTAFQLWMMAMALLTFAAAYGLFRQAIGTGSLAASIGAFVFAFGAPRVAQTGHQQLIAHFYTVGAVYALVRIFSPAPELRARASIRIAAICLGLALAAQFYASFYYGWFAVLALAIAVFWSMVLPQTRSTLARTVRQQWPSLAMGAAAGVAALLPLASKYLQAASAVGVRSFETVLGMCPPPQAWLYSGSSSWLYGWTADWSLFTRITTEWEQQLSVGLLTACIAGCGLLSRPRRRLVVLFGLTAVTLVVLVSSVAGSAPLWRVVYELVPGAAAMRAVSRVGLLLLLPISLGVALFVDRIASRRCWWTPPLLLFVVLEQGRTTTSYDKHEARQRHLAVASRVAPTCDAFYYSSPDADAWFVWVQLDAMWAQLATGVPTVNGRSGNNPPKWPFRRLWSRHRDEEELVPPALREWLARGDSSATTSVTNVCWIRSTREPAVVIPLRPVAETSPDAAGNERVP